MNSKIKSAAALTALTLATTLALPSSEAHAQRRGFGIAAGIVGAGILAGSIAAAAAAEPVYLDGAYRKCRWVAQYDGWGNYLGTSKVCRIYYY